MMRRGIRYFVVFFCLILLALPAAAADAPAAWAAEAVDWAVARGVLAQSAVRPTEKVDRAELAGMLVRLLGAQGETLEGYSDVKPGDPCYADMAGAVGLGLFQGDDQGRLRPQQVLTREQAMAVLARCFGVSGGTGAELNEFSDAARISDWAVRPMADMVAAGYAKGSRGALRPQDAITQQELVQLVYTMSGEMVFGDALPESGNIVLRAGEKLPANVQIDGNLILGCDLGEEVTLRGVRVSGRLVLHGGTVRLTGGTKAAEVVCAGGAVTLESGSSLPIRVSGGSAVLSGGGEVNATAPVTLRSGRFSQVSAEKAEVTVEQPSSVSDAILKQGSRLTGDGRVSNVTLRSADCAVELDAGQVEERLDAGLGPVTITAAQPANDAKPAEPTVTTTVQFDQVDLTNGDGEEEGVRYCTLEWYVDGVLTERQLRFPLQEGATASFTTKASYTGRLREKMTILARLCYGKERVELSQTVDLHLELVPLPVKTMEVEATVLRDTGLYSTLSLGGRIGTVPAGTRVIYFCYYGITSGKIRLPDGRVGWVRWSDLKISLKNYVQKDDYPQIIKERFANEKGYKSSTKMLVWISLLTQKINVFEGSAGNWKLIKTFPCTTGHNTTPTIAGVFRYSYRQDIWDYGTYYVKRPMIFNGGHAFHSRLYLKPSNELLDASIGIPKSHGCIRMYDDDLNWMWNNMRVGTTVVVY